MEKLIIVKGGNMVERTGLDIDFSEYISFCGSDFGTMYIVYIIIKKLK